MIEVEIDDEMLIKARSMAAEMGPLRNSITKGAGNLYGFLGELLYAKYKGLLQTNTYHYDLQHSDGTTVEVKTKKTSVKPKPHYECSVAAYNTKQVCDIYVFVRVKDDLTVGWLLGYLTKNEFYEKAKKYEKGDRDPSNGFIVKAACYSVPINELREIEKEDQKKRPLAVRRSTKSR